MILKLEQLQNRKSPFWHPTIVWCPLSREPLRTST